MHGEGCGLRDRQRGAPEEVKTLMMAKKILTNQGKPAMVQQPASFLQVAEKMIPGSLLDKKSPFYTRQLAAANFLRNFDPDSWVLMQVSDKVLADPFGKVKDMLYGMIEKLEKEQAAEQEHKAWCDKEMAKTTKEEKKKSARLNQVTIRKEKATADITKLGEDLITLQDDLQKLDLAVKESTKLRNKGAAEWAEESAEYKAGQEACAAAIKVLNNYYGSKKEELLQTRIQLKGAGGIIGLLEVAESDFAKSLAEGQAAEDAVLEYLDKIKSSCETKTPSHEERQARRAKEME